MDMPLRLDDLGDGCKIIFAFQHWCPAYCEGLTDYDLPGFLPLHAALAEHFSQKGRRDRSDSD
jgi:hypothetical protein